MQKEKTHQFMQLTTQKALWHRLCFGTGAGRENTGPPTLTQRTFWRHAMTIKESAYLLFEITHPEQAVSFAALKEYLENMYFG